MRKSKNRYGVTRSFPDFSKVEIQSWLGRRIKSGMTVDMFNCHGNDHTTKEKQEKRRMLWI